MRSPFRSLPIAWLQLTHGRTKLVAAVVGIVFADLLMWMQLGFLARHWRARRLSIANCAEIW